MSFSGMAGGFWATSTFLLATAVAIINQHDNWGRAAAFYGVFALAFVPAIVFSIIPSPRRETVLRAETALCMVLAFFGLFFFDPGIAVLLSPPTVLLAQAAGLIFSSGGSKEKTKG